MSQMTMRHGRNDGKKSAIWIANGNSLIFIGIIANNTFSKNIEWSVKQDIICRAMNDMNLNIEGDFANSHRYVVH